MRRLPQNISPEPDARTLEILCEILPTEVEQRTQGQTVAWRDQSSFTMVQTRRQFRSIEAMDFVEFITNGLEPGSISTTKHIEQQALRSGFSVSRSQDSSRLGRLTSLGVQSALLTRKMRGSCPAE